jgi:acyl dehydratase
MKSPRQPGGFISEQNKYLTQVTNKQQNVFKFATYDHNLYHTDQYHL